ncbi:hypothetical protein D3C78_1545260 [compost metagenome]
MLDGGVNAANAVPTEKPSVNVIAVSAGTVSVPVPGSSLHAVRKLLIPPAGPAGPLNPLGPRGPLGPCKPRAP